MSSAGEDQFLQNGSITHPDGTVNNNPRLECATDALNDAVELLMQGDYNRVSLVTFDIETYTVLPLSRYSKSTVNRTESQSGGYRNGEDRYFTIAQCGDYDDRFEQIMYNGRYQDSGGLADDWKIIEINAVDEQGSNADIKARGEYKYVKNGKQLSLPYIYTSSGTDTYWGIRQGMQILANEKDTKLKLYKDANGN